MVFNQEVIKDLQVAWTLELSSNASNMQHLAARSLEVLNYYNEESGMPQYYIGSKQIQAWPFEFEGREGYNILYPDGYESWSPKETFEAAYLPMGDATDGSKVTQQMVDDFIVGHDARQIANSTVVMTVLKNGFTVLTESACVDPANYDHVLGTELAIEKAKAQVWHLLGFLLATARNGVVGEP